MSDEIGVTNSGIRIEIIDQYGDITPLAKEIFRLGLANWVLATTEGSAEKGTPLRIPENADWDTYSHVENVTICIDWSKE